MGGLRPNLFDAGQELRAVLGLGRIVACVSKVVLGLSMSQPGPTRPMNTWHMTMLRVFGDPFSNPSLQNAISRGASYNLIYSLGPCGLSLRKLALLPPFLLLLPPTSLLLSLIRDRQRHMCLSSLPVFCIFFLYVRKSFPFSIYVSLHKLMNSRFCSFISQLRFQNPRFHQVFVLFVCPSS